MLKTRTAEQYLEQAITSGILGVFLFNSDGLPFARTGKMASSATVYGALMINIWDSFEQQGIREDLQSVVLQNTEGTVMVVKIHQMLLAIVADTSVTQGILRAKVMALTAHLVEPLGML